MKSKKPKSPSPKTYYLQPHDTVSKDLISRFFTERGHQVESTYQNCADGISRDLWQVPNELFPFILGELNARMNVFQDEGNGIVPLSTGSFMTLALDPVFDKNVARAGLVYHACNNKFDTLLHDLKQFGEQSIQGIPISVIEHSIAHPRKTRQQVLKSGKSWQLGPSGRPPEDETGVKKKVKRSTACK